MCQDSMKVQHNIFYDVQVKKKTLTSTRQNYRTIFNFAFIF